MSKVGLLASFGQIIYSLLMGAFQHTQINEECKPFMCKRSKSQDFACYKTVSISQNINKSETLTNNLKIKLLTLLSFLLDKIKQRINITNFPCPKQPQKLEAENIAKDFASLFSSLITLSSLNFMGFTQTEFFHRLSSLSPPLAAPWPRGFLLCVFPRRSQHWPAKKRKNIERV